MRPDGWHGGPYAASVSATGDRRTVTRVRQTSREEDALNMEELATALAVIVIAICLTVFHVIKLKSYDVAEEIRKLAELEKEGYLTQEEFEQRKTKLLKD